MVCGEGHAPGDLHGNLGTIHLQLRNLFQAGRIAGEAEMTSFSLFYIGVIVFILALIGGGLTLIDFRNMK